MVSSLWWMYNLFQNHLSCTFYLGSHLCSTYWRSITSAMPLAIARIASSMDSTCTTLYLRKSESVSDEWITFNQTTSTSMSHLQCSLPPLQQVSRISCRRCPALAAPYSSISGAKWPFIWTSQSQTSAVMESSSVSSCRIDGSLTATAIPGPLAVQLANGKQVCLSVC